MRKAPCKNADQSSLQEALVNPEGVREIIHPAPSRNQGGKYILETMKIGTREFPVSGYVTDECIGTVRAVDIPMISDLKWQLRCLRDRLENPEAYQRIGEDVEATIASLREWLAERGMKA